MGIRVTCKACETSFSVADDRRGKKIRCKECEEICVVPSGGNAGGASNGKRKRDADDERSTPDDDERPRSKKAAKGGNPMLPLALGGGAVVLVLFLLCGGGGAAYFLFFKGRPAPAQDNQPIAAAPDARDKQAEKPAAPPDNQPVAPAPANKKIDEKPVTVPLAGGGGRRRSCRRESGMRRLLKARNTRPRTSGSQSSCRPATSRGNEPKS